MLIKIISAVIAAIICYAVYLVVVYAFSVIGVPMQFVAIVAVLILLAFVIYLLRLFNVGV